MLRTCLSNDIIVHDFSFNYFCKHCIHCICYCSKFCTLTLNLYIFERRNKINLICSSDFSAFNKKIFLEWSQSLILALAVIIDSDNYERIRRSYYSVHVHVNPSKKTKSVNVREKNHFRNRP